MASAAVQEGAVPAVPPIMGPAQDHGWRPLTGGWVVLPTCRLAGFPATARPQERRFLLMHADYGIAVLDLWSPATAAAAADAADATVLLEAQLRLASFLRRFDPRLPIRRIHLAEPELPRLAGVLARAFAGAEPLQLPGGDAWMGAVQGALAAPPAVPAAPPLPRPHPRPTGWYRLAAGAAAFGSVAVAALLLTRGNPAAEPPHGAGTVPGIGSPPAAGAPSPPAIRSADAGEGPVMTAQAILSDPGTALPASAEPEQMVAADATPAGETVMAAEGSGMPAPTLELPRQAVPALPSIPAMARLQPLPAVWRLDPLPVSAAFDAGAVPMVLLPAAVRLPPMPAEDGLAVIARLPEIGAMPHVAPPEAPRIAAPPEPRPVPPAAAQAPLPEPVVPGLPLADADAMRAAPLPEPATLPAAPFPPPADSTRLDPLPEPEAPHLPPLAAADTDAAPAAPPPQEAPPAPSAIGTAPPPEAPPAAPSAVGATRAAPAPEPAAPRDNAPPSPAAAPPPAAPSAIGATRAAPAPEPAAPRDSAPPSPAAVPPPPAPAAAATAPASARPQQPTVTLDPKVIEMLIARGNEMLARGDISAARLLYGRAAAAGSVAALTAMGRSYDPVVLEALGVRGIRPDPEQAALWYRRAAERGAGP